jgi:hypothetical protein
MQNIIEHNPIDSFYYRVYDMKTRNMFVAMFTGTLQLENLILF